MTNYSIFFVDLLIRRKNRYVSIVVKFLILSFCTWESKNLIFKTKTDANLAFSLFCKILKG